MRGSKMPVRLHFCAASVRGELSGRNSFSSPKVTSGREVSLIVVKIIFLAAGPGDKVSMRGIALMDGFPQPGGAVDSAGDLDRFFVLSLDPFGIVLVTEFFGGFIAVFLEVMDLASEAGEDGELNGAIFCGQWGVGAPVRVSV